MREEREGGEGGGEGGGIFRGKLFSSTSRTKTKFKTKIPPSLFLPHFISLLLLSLPFNLSLFLPLPFPSPLFRLSLCIRFRCITNAKFKILLSQGISFRPLYIALLFPLSRILSHPFTPTCFATPSFYPSFGFSTRKYLESSSTWVNLFSRNACLCQLHFSSKFSFCFDNP